MQTIGDLLKTSRKNKKITLNNLEERTKIKKEFIVAIEDEKWEKLPEYPVVLGFVKNIAAVLDVDPEKAAAILRRDYPPKEVKINPKPQKKKIFVWNPKTTFILGGILLIIVIASYLAFQYSIFVRPPSLEVVSPAEQALVTESVLIVTGSTDPDSTLLVNNQPVVVNKNGSFETELSINSETTEIVVLSKSRSGKETTIRRNIVFEE